jgi:predicted nucleotidyltransferase
LSGSKGPSLVPLPHHLEGLASLIRTWAKDHSDVRRVFLYGSTLRGTPNPDDLDLALELDVPDDAILPTLIRVQSRWARELSELTGLNVDLQIAQPTVPHVWDYIHQGCGLVFQR